MDQNSLVAVRRYFREYYFRNAEMIRPPSEMSLREFGYLPFGGGMIRHLAFSEIGNLRALLVREAPAGVYCSNSLYHDPSAEMTKKGWLRAEPIFDIDADALNLPCKKKHDIWLCKDCGKKEFGLRPETCPNCKKNRLLEFSWACPECIEGTRKETFRLLDFLRGDFGLSDSQISIYFSGNAGFHVHVKASSLDKVEQAGRSEISDYITGRGLMSSLLKNSKLTPNDWGWRGRIARFVRDIPVGSSPFKTDEFRSRVNEIQKRLKEDQINKILDSVLAANAVRIDPMVTADIHRIFRMPETLNNKTGLIKKQCKDLQTFNPLAECVALPEDTDLVALSVDMCPKICLGGMEFGPFVRVARIELPLFVAVYLIARGAAKVFSDSSRKAEAGQPKTASNPPATN